MVRRRYANDPQDSRGQNSPRPASLVSRSVSSQQADLYAARKAASNSNRSSSDFNQDRTTPRSSTPHPQLFTDEDAKLGQGAGHTTSLWHFDNLKAFALRCPIQVRHSRLA